MKRSTLLLIFLLQGFLPIALSAQMAGMEWLTTKQGLSQGFVGCLLQDREGFIWAGTKTASTVTMAIASMSLLKTHTTNIPSPMIISPTWTNMATLS
ncbi:MAG: hypothetical protein H7246_11485 [Phycisphaerae bacterium]|nr:hypothetical protein [Saprospiraceae bacterium]